MANIQPPPFKLDYILKEVLVYLQIVSQHNLVIAQILTLSFYAAVPLLEQRKDMTLILVPKSKFHYNKPTENSYSWIAVPFHTSLARYDKTKWGVGVVVNLWLLCPWAHSFWVSCSFQVLWIFHEWHRFYFQSWYQPALRSWENVVRWQGKGVILRSGKHWTLGSRPSRDLPGEQTKWFNW